MDKKTDRGQNNTSRRDFLKISGLSVGAMTLGSLSGIELGFAKDVYPAGRITYILPHKAGGGHDIYARAISPYLTKYLREASPGAKGGDLVMRNEPAAAGRKGYSLLFNAKPDGYTIGAIDTAPVTDNIMGKQEFDFTTLTFLLLAVSTSKMIVTSKKGFNSWNDALNAQKKEPVKMAVGSYGRANHVSAIVMNERMGTKFKLIPLPGTAESINAVMRGDTQLTIVSEDTVGPLLEAGELKVLLQFDNKTEYPGAVNVKELGFPDLANSISSHRFIIAPPGLAAEPKRILIAALKKATTDKDFVAWANKFQFPLRNIFGDDARKMFLQFIKYYDDLAPLLKKQLA